MTEKQAYQVSILCVVFTQEVILTTVVQRPSHWPHPSTRGWHLSSRAHIPPKCFSYKFETLTLLFPCMCISIWCVSMCVLTHVVARDCYQVYSPIAHHLTSLRQCLSFNLELTDSAKLAGQWALLTHPSLSPRIRITGRPPKPMCTHIQGILTQILRLGHRTLHWLSHLPSTCVNIWT